MRIPAVQALATNEPRPRHLHPRSARTAFLRAHGAGPPIDTAIRVCYVKSRKGRSNRIRRRNGIKPALTGGKLVQMDRAIFDLKASVEATSLYILLCAIVDDGESPTLSMARAKWNGTPETLTGAAEELVTRGVLRASGPITLDTPLTVISSENWF